MIEIGQVVKLKSNDNILMTVKHVDTQIECIWFETYDKNPFLKKFAPKLLDIEDDTIKRIKIEIGKSVKLKSVDQ